MIPTLILCNRSSSGLTWHEDTIPSNEVWVKLAGDKGRGSFKCNMQVVNVAHPNSTRNSCLLAVFKAGDSVTNLHIGLDQYAEHIEELQGMKWRSVTSITETHIFNATLLYFRDWTIQLYFSGDYEFLCTMYGLSGASGEQ